MSLALRNDRISLTIDPDNGARVTQLTDRASGRQWLVTEPQTATVAAAATWTRGVLNNDGAIQDDATLYGTSQSFGWDECFPTVAPCDDPAWGGRIRDHGVLWGRPWQVVNAGPDCVETRFTAPTFVFARTVTLTGGSIVADYAVTNTAPAHLPYIWSQHCLLATTPADRIALAGIGRMTARGKPYDWPHHNGRDLSRIGSRDDGFALKSYAPTPAAASAAVTGPDGGLRFDWHGVPALGLWLSFGGWPDPASGVHQIAIEPTTAPADHLAAAAAMGMAATLAPDATHRWTVRLTLTDPEPQTKADM